MKVEMNGMAQTLGLRRCSAGPTYRDDLPASTIPEIIDVQKGNWRNADEGVIVLTVL